MSRTRSLDYEKALALLRAAFGDFNPKQSVRKIISRAPDFGKFEWMLTIIALEIDLRVDIPESLADDHSRTADRFCRLVADLPKVDAPGYTIDCLSLVAQALLSLDEAMEPAEKLPKRRRVHKATARGTKVPRRRETTAKRAARATARPVHEPKSTGHRKRTRT